MFASSVRALGFHSNFDAIEFFPSIQIHHTDNFLELLITALQVIYAFGVLFVSCELGQRITVAFDECSVMIDQFDWYLFPVEIQRMLLIVINFAQQPIVIKCFGSAACDRETFKYVRVPKFTSAIHFFASTEIVFQFYAFQIIKSAFSYFTMLRQFYD